MDSYWLILHHLAAAVAGAALLAASHYVRTGLPPLVDPANHLPLIDAIRDVVRVELARRPEPPPDPPQGPRLAA